MPLHLRPRLDARLTIRARLTLWYVVLLAIILTAFSGFLYWNLARGLIQESRALLEAHSQQIMTELEIENGRLQWREPAELVPAGTVTALYDLQGRLLGGSPDLPTSITPPVSPEPNAIIWEDAQNDDWLILKRPVKDGGQVIGWLTVARSQEPIEAALHRLFLVILLAIPLTLALAMGGGLFLARRALDPIDQITRTAQAISRGRTSQRLGWPGARDEVGRLALTFDEMLDALEDSLERQRRFTADASHELRTPLAVIRAEAEAALERPRLAEYYQQALQHITEQAERMSRLVNDLLFLARSDAREQKPLREDLDLAELVSGVVEEMQSLAASKGINLEAEIHEPLPYHGDQTRLTQLLLNLVDNALAYTPAGGRVSVQAYRAGREVILEVQDTGSGIAAEDLPHIFERFYRADQARSRARGGSGLGLAIAKRIAEAHGGRLEVASQVGQGSTFTVYLPQPAPGRQV